MADQSKARKLPVEWGEQRACPAENSKCQADAHDELVENTDDLLDLVTTSYKLPGGTDPKAHLAAKAYLADRLNPFAAGLFFGRYNRYYGGGTVVFRGV
jgi:hypothetical protein